MNVLTQSTAPKHPMLHTSSPAHLQVSLWLHVAPHAAKRSNQLAISIRQQRCPHDSSHSCSGSSHGGSGSRHNSRCRQRQCNATDDIPTLPGTLHHPEPNVAASWVPTCAFDLCFMCVPCTAAAILQALASNNALAVKPNAPFVGSTNGRCYVLHPITEALYSPPPPSSHCPPGMIVW